MTDNPFVAGSQKDSQKSSQKPLFTKDEIVSWIKSGSKPSQSNINALLVGHPKCGKTGVALDCRTEESKKAGRKIIAFELNSDCGCETNRKEHHNNDPNIIILNPRVYSMDEYGDYQPDYKATITKIRKALIYLRENHEEENVQAIVFDGLDIFLSEICESQMRIDENLDITDNVTWTYWRKRNEYYFNTLNILFDIDVDKYLICHFAARRKDSKTSIYTDDRQVAVIDSSLVYACQKTTPDKVNQIIEFQDKSKIVDGKKHVKLTATIVADRTNLENHLKEFTIAETVDGQVRWYGIPILRR